jgi:RHS repeat-associated protein
VTITNPTAMPLRFPGQYFQIEDGLSYNWHRNYDPTLGRYSQADPLGFVDGPGVYNYVLSSPLMGVDPSGRQQQQVIKDGVMLWGGIGIIACVGIPACRDFLLPMCVKADYPQTPPLMSTPDRRKPSGKPGPFANPEGGVPVGKPNARPTSGEQGQVNGDGDEFGCHECGTSDPGTQSGNWVGDHQPPSSQNPTGGPQSLYPHCVGCSTSQGGRLRWQGR